jgi:hypothetical protein
MFSSKQHIEKSRLGRLLVNRGYISEAQLDIALQAQRASGKRLGEVLIESGLLSDKDLSRTLKHQSRYRYTAAFVAMVVTPLQPLVAFAATPTVQTNSDTSSLQLSQVAKKGMQPLDDFEMSDVAAQGIQDDVRALLGSVDEHGNVDGVKTLGALTKLLLPASQLLDADVSMEGVHYDASRSKMVVSQDGSINVAMPSLIEEIRIENIHVAGSTGASFGSVIVSGVQFTDNFSMVIRPNN